VANADIGKIMSGILMIQVLGLWHDGLLGMSYPSETRLVQRACGDCFVTNYYSITQENLSTEAFGYEPDYGQGVYHYVRSHAEMLGRYLPSNGFDKTKDFPRGGLFY
jgi:hypothetical protein